MKCRSAALRRLREADLARASHRSLQSRGMSVDSRLLIKQIEARPALWNRDDKHYCYQQIVSKQWAEIALIHGVHESKVKSKWKALRDTFRQELKKNPQQSLWKYYLDMQFLKGQIKTLPKAPNKPGFEEDHEEVTFVKTEPEDANPPCQEGSNGEERHCGAMEVPQDIPDVDDNADDNDDDDYHFLMSLLPQMRKLHPRQKLLLRIKMMELFYKEVYPEEL